MTEVAPAGDSTINKLHPTDTDRLGLERWLHCPVNTDEDLGLVECVASDTRIRRISARRRTKNGRKAWSLHADINLAILKRTSGHVDDLRDLVRHIDRDDTNRTGRHDTVVV